MDSMGLTRDLKVARELDEFIRHHQQMKGRKPSVLYVTRKQMAQLLEHTRETDPTSRDEWLGIPLKVHG